MTLFRTFAAETPLRIAVAAVLLAFSIGAEAQTAPQRSDLSAVQYPGEKNLAIVTFDQNYQSSNLNGQTRKRQLWQLIDGRWQIIYEGSA